jgi:hypothetical protein
MLKITKLSKKSLIIGSVATLLLVGGASAYFATRPDESHADVTQNVSDQNSANKTKASTGNAQQKTTETGNSNTTTTPTNPSPQVTVTITAASQAGNAITIAAYSNYSQAGTCTVNFRHGSEVVTKSVPSYLDASGKNICDFPSDVRCVDTGSGTEACHDPFIKRSDFSVAGQWEVTVSFTASGVSGQSAAQTITIT